MATISGKNDHAAGFFISESPAYNGVKNTHACILFGKFLKSKFFRLFRTVEVGAKVTRVTRQCYAHKPAKYRHFSIGVNRRKHKPSFRWVTGILSVIGMFRQSSGKLDRGQSSL